MQTIEFDLPCARCGYNLRTLPRDGVCPECGETVEQAEFERLVQTSTYGRLRTLAPARLQSARRGVWLAWIAWAAALVGVLYDDRPPFFNEWWAGTIWLTPPVAIYVTSCWGAWHLAGVWPARVARGVRATLAINLVGLALSFINWRWLRFYFDLRTSS